MEKQFENKNEQYFKEFLDHHDNIVRTRAVCILAGIGAENAVEPIGKVLKYDKNALVRHEAGFFTWPAWIQKRHTSPCGCC